MTGPSAALRGSRHEVPWPYQMKESKMACVEIEHRVDGRTTERYRVRGTEGNLEEQMANLLLGYCPEGITGKARWAQLQARLLMVQELVSVGSRDRSVRVDLIERDSAAPLTRVLL